MHTIFSRAEPPLSLIGCSRGLNSVSREATPANSCSSKFFICSSSSLRLKHYSKLYSKLWAIY